MKHRELHEEAAEALRLSVPSTSGLRDETGDCVRSDSGLHSFSTLNLGSTR